MKNIRVKNLVNFVFDASFEWKICREPCGGAAHKPCSRCNCLRTPDGHNIGYAFVIVEIPVDSKETPQEFATRHHMSLDKLQVFPNVTDLAFDCILMMLTNNLCCRIVGAARILKSLLH